LPPSAISEFFSFPGRWFTKKKKQKKLDFDSAQHLKAQTMLQVSIPLELGGLNLAKTFYIFPAHHLGTFQCWSYKRRRFNFTCFRSAVKQPGTLQKSSLPQMTKQYTRDQFKFWLDFNHIYNLTEEQIGSSLHRMDLTTQHVFNDHRFRSFDFTIRSTVTLHDIASQYLIANGTLLTAFKDKVNKYLPLLTPIKPPGHTFQVLAFNTYGLALAIISYLTSLSPDWHRYLLIIINTSHQSGSI
jgi:hypothetical protein